jgi:tricorn protease
MPRLPPVAPKPPAKKEEPTRIDLDGIDQRIIALPIPARNYLGLTVGKANMIYILDLPTSPPAPGQTGWTVQKFDLEKRKLEKALDGVTSFQVSANGEKVLYRQGQNWIIGSTSSLGGPSGLGGPGGPGAPAAPSGPGASPGGPNI